MPGMKLAIKPERPFRRKRGLITMISNKHEKRSIEFDKR